VLIAMAEPEVGVSWARFYVLILFSLFTMEQCANWNTFGPIALSAQIVFCWPEQTIFHLSSIGLYGFIVCIVPCTYLLNRSLRWSVILGCFMLMLGTLLRCIPLVYPSIPLQHYTILVYLSACCISTAGPIAMSAPLQLTAHWFPPRERNLATSVGQLFNVLGIGVSGILGLAMVPSKPSDIELGTGCGAKGHNIPFTELVPKETVDEIMNLNYFHAAVVTVLFVLLILYFPSKPAKPPSLSSAEVRLDFLGGFKILAKSRDAWFVLVTYAFPQCLIQLWQSSMVIIFTELELKFPDQDNSFVDERISEYWVDILLVVMCLVSVFTSIIVASFLSVFKKKMKLTIIILLCMSAVIFIFCTLILEQIIKFNSLSDLKLALYLLLLPAMTLSLTSSPIAFELSVETSYPVSEGVIGGWLTGWFNVLGGVFFVISFANIGTRWLHYVLPVSVIVPLPAIAMVSESYSRLKTDQRKQSAEQKDIPALEK